MCEPVPGVVTTVWMEVKHGLTFIDIVAATLKHRHNIASTVIQLSVLSVISVNLPF